MSNLTTAVQTILDNKDFYVTAENYYNGDVDEIFASPAVKRALRKTGDQFRVNFAATPVNAVANRLEISSVTAVSENANKVIDNIWTTNELVIEIEKTMKQALIYGDSYMFVWSIDGEIEAYYNSPKSTVVIYQEENPRKPSFAAKMWTDSATDKIRVNLYYADRIEKYTTKSTGNLPMTIVDKDFEAFVDEDTDDAGVMENLFGRIPVIHFRTDTPYGTPEHKNAFGPQDMINKLVVSQMASIEFYGFPQRVILLDEKAAADGTGGDFENDVDEDDSEGLSAEPGSNLILKGVKSIHQLATADGKTYLEPYREYIRSMASVTETPLHYFENTHTNVSGESLRAAEAPLVKKVRTRQLSFGSSLREVFKFILGAEGINEDVQVHWKSIESVDSKERWEINYKKVQAGLPVAQMLKEEGYDSALVDSWTLVDPKNTGQIMLDEPEVDENVEPA